MPCDMSRALVIDPAVSSSEKVLPVLEVIC